MLRQDIKRIVILAEMYLWTSELYGIKPGSRGPCAWFVTRREENIMYKSIGMLLGGVFVGAVGMELLNRQCPNVFGKLYDKTRDVASGAKQAFKDGYEHATQPEEPELSVAPTT